MIFLTYAIVTMNVLNKFEIMVVAAVLGGVLLLPGGIVSTEKHIRILRTDDNSIEFGVRDAEYAKMLTELNNSTPPKKSSGMSSDDGGQAFAA